jgi:uncharacterized protein HemX
MEQEAAGSSSIILWLFAMTLFAALAIGIWQWVRVRNAKRNNEHSVATTPKSGPDPHA